MAAENAMPRSLRSVFRTLSPIILTLALAHNPAPLDAQQPPPGLVEVREGNRRGFWFGIGVGAGGESNDLVGGTGNDYSDLFYQPTISFRAGGTVGRHWRVGGEFLSWINEEGDAVESLSSALFVAQLYPFTSTGFYLKGGVGIGRNAVDFDYGFNVGDTGLAGLVGAGIELRLGRHIYLNPALDLVGHTYDARAGGSYRERLVNFGFGILVQPGGL